MRMSRILLSGLAALTFLSTAIDETFRTAGDVVKENPRYQNQRNEPKPTVSLPTPGAEEDYYYKAEVLVKTHGPAQIESLSLQQTEDVSEFWR
ncbi:MAG: hypothetical protein P8X63_05870 [Desulfuromonadaceae bacterium]